MKKKNQQISISDENIESYLKTNKDFGLSNNEVLERRSKFGLNILKKTKRELFIVAFLLLTGARKREVLDAKWKDINFSQKTWKIPKTKSGKIRFIPLCPQCIKLLNKLFISSLIILIEFTP